MTRVLLLVATLVDSGLVLLLVGVSGFVFGHGPEGMRGHPTAVASWSAMLLMCIAAPIAGFVLHSRGTPALGAVLAWLPPLMALLITFGVFDRLFLR